jgi:hypothetical protein
MAACHSGKWCKTPNPLAPCAVLVPQAPDAMVAPRVFQVHKHGVAEEGALVRAPTLFIGS